MKNLIIHVGFGKTGSSYIQSALALNQKQLKKNSIYYPDHPRSSAASQGEITSGNISPALDLDANAKKAARWTLCNSLLYSNEGLFGDLHKNQERYRELNKKFRLHIILYIRNPLSHAISCYQQTVKRGGSVISAGAYISEHYKHINLLEAVIEFLEREDIPFTVLNYSKWKYNLLDSFYRAIGADSAENFTPPVKDKINRSMTNSEIKLQRLFNRYVGKSSSRFISDPLCEELADIDSEIPHFSRAEYDAFVQRIESQVDRLNGQLSASEKLILADYPFDDKPSSENLACFNDDQLDVVVREIATRLDVVRELEEHVDDFRDLALKLEQDNQYGVETAYTLIKAANLLRPEGPRIRNKLKEYREKLSSNN